MTDRFSSLRVWIDLEERLAILLFSHSPTSKILGSTGVSPWIVLSDVKLYAWRGV